MPESAQTLLSDDPSPQKKQRQTIVQPAGKAVKKNQPPEQTVEYIAELAEQLAVLASSINEESLAYFLSMARAEAELVALRQAAQQLPD